MSQSLTNAIIVGDVGRLTRYLQRGKRQDRRNRDGLTLLMIAALFRQRDVATLLLDHGADINAVDKDCLTAVHHSLRSLESLPPRTSTPAGQVGFTEIPTWARTKEAQHDMVRLLLDHGANLNPPNRPDNATMRTRKRFRTPLQMAVILGCTSLTKMLLSNGARINERDMISSTALIDAAEHHPVTILPILIHAGADTQLKRMDGFTALHGVLKHLIKRCQRAAGDAPDGRISIDKRIALTAPVLPIIETLLKAGAQTDAGDIHNVTPLDLALTLGEPSVLRLLAQSSQDINKPNPRQQTALHRLTQQPLSETHLVALAELLLDTGADPQLLDDASRSPASLALEQGLTQLAERLAHP